MRYKDIHRGASLPFPPEFPRSPSGRRDRVHAFRKRNACGYQEVSMFEAAQEQKRSGSNRMLVTIFVVVAAVAVGAVLYTISKSSAKPAAPVNASAAAPAAAVKADPVHDLKILSTRMEKDNTGTTAVWLVDINNK